MSNVKTGEFYLCGIDWQHELGEAADGTTIFPSQEWQKKFHPTEGCGVVKVRATFELLEWVEKQDLQKGAIGIDEAQAAMKATMSREYAKGMLSGAKDTIASLRSIKPKRHSMEEGLLERLVASVACYERSLE